MEFYETIKNILNKLDIKMIYYNEIDYNTKILLIYPYFDNPENPMYLIHGTEIKIEMDLNNNNISQYITEELLKILSSNDFKEDLIIENLKYYNESSNQTKIITNNINNLQNKYKNLLEELKKGNQLWEN